MAELMEFLKIYKDLGVAALFIALYLVTVYFFYKELKNSKDEVVVMTEKVTAVLDKAATAITEMNKTTRDGKDSIDQLRNQNEQFLSFLRGRDEHRRRS